MSGLLTVRYPSGATEFRMSGARNGDNWIIEEVTNADDGTSVARLRPGPKPVGVGRRHMRIAGVELPDGCQASPSP